MSEYLVLPISMVELSGYPRTMPVTVCWKLPSVAALVRVVSLVDTPLQARAIAGMPCSLQLAHYTMGDVEMRHLDDPVWLRAHVGHHLVMKPGDDIVVGLGSLTQSAWRVREIGLMAIVRLPPSCFMPRDTV